MTDPLQTPISPWPENSSAEAFKTTQWSVILSAGAVSDSVSRRALERLCSAYWFPIFAYVRRQGRSPEDAQDLTQEFFARFLEHGYFARADRDRGRFRTFLLTSLKHFLNEDWKKSTRIKRGGVNALQPLSIDDAELRYAAGFRDTLSPDHLYERRWAEALLERVLHQLQCDYAATGRGEIYRQLQQFLWGRQAELSYADMGTRLGMNEGAVKVAVHRLRQRFRQLLHQEVAQTVEHGGEIEAELRYLLEVFAR